MESVTTLLEGEWNSFNGVDANEDAYFMSQLLANFSSFPNDSSEIPSAFWPDHELTTSVNNVYEASHYWLDNTNTNPYSLSQDDSYNDVSSTLFPTSSSKSYEKSISSKGNEIAVPEPSTENNNFSVNSRKRSCSMADVCDSREKTKCRKSEKLVLNGNEDDADGDAVCKKITKIYRSDDDSNWSQESSRSPKQKGAEILNSNGKTRAGRGSATDPQSVYARKRRERINERLRILQHLIPNGTKVDISTMLEEAVQYVKFLQLQIKLLSSDDLWMYAPIAYNGMDIGLDNLMIPSP